MRRASACESVGGSMNLVLREVEVLDYNGVNVAGVNVAGKTATQSTTVHGNVASFGASKALDNQFGDANGQMSHTDKSGSEYHISACKFPNYHVSF